MYYNNNMELPSSPPAEPQRTPRKRSQKPDAVTIKVKLKSPVTYEKRQWFCDFGTRKPMEGVNTGERVTKRYENTIKDLREIMANKGVLWNCCEDANAVITAFLGDQPILKEGFRRPEGKRIEILFSPVASSSKIPKSATLPNKLLLSVVRSSNINTARSKDDPMPSLTPVLSNATTPLLYQPLPAAKAKARKRPSVIKTGTSEDGSTTSLNLNLSNVTTPFPDNPANESEDYPVTLMIPDPGNVAFPCFNELMLQTNTEARNQSSSITIEESEDGPTNSFNPNLNNVTTPYFYEPIERSEDYLSTLMMTDPSNVTLPCFNEPFLPVKTKQRNRSSVIKMANFEDAPTSSFNPDPNNVPTTLLDELTEEYYSITLMMTDPSNVTCFNELLLHQAETEARNRSSGITIEKFEDHTTSFNPDLNNVTTLLPEEPTERSEDYPSTLMMTNPSNVTFPWFDEPLVPVKTETSNRSSDSNTANSEDSLTTSLNLNLSNDTNPLSDELTEESEYYPITLMASDPNNVTTPLLYHPLPAAKAEAKKRPSVIKTSHSADRPTTSFNLDLHNISTPYFYEPIERSEDYPSTLMMTDPSNVALPCFNELIANTEARKRSTVIKTVSSEDASITSMELGRSDFTTPLINEPIERSEDYPSTLMMTDPSNVTFPWFNEPLVPVKTETSNRSSDSNTEKSKNDLINSLTPDLNNVATPLPDELTKKSEDYSMTSLTPNSSNVTFPSLNKRLVPGTKTKAKKRLSSGIRMTSLTPNSSNVTFPSLNKRLVPGTKTKAKKRLSSGIRMTSLTPNSSNVTYPSLHKPLVSLKTKAKKRLSSAIKKTSLNPGLNNAITPLLKDRLLQPKTKARKRSPSIKIKKSEDGSASSLDLYLGNVTTQLSDALKEKFNDDSMTSLTLNSTNVTFPSLHKPLVPAKTSERKRSLSMKIEKSEEGSTTSLHLNLNNVTTQLSDEPIEKSEDYPITLMTGWSNAAFSCCNELIRQDKTESINSEDGPTTSLNLNFSNVTTPLPNEPTEKSEDYHISLMIPDPDATFPYFTKLLVPAKTKTRNRSSSMNAGKTKIDPINSLLTPDLNNVTVTLQDALKEKSKEDSMTSLILDSSNVAVPSLHKPLVSLKIKAKKRLSSAIKKTSLNAGKNSAITPLLKDRLLQPKTKAWFPNQEEQTELYKSDSFVVEADQISRPTAQTVLWRIFEETGIISLQKYEGRDMNGRVFHWVQNNFRIVETKDRAFFIKYHPVYVKVLQDTERVKVVQYFKVDQIVPNILRMRATQGLFYNYKVLIHMMLTELLNWPPGFIKSRVSANSDQCEEYYKTSWDVTESAINDRAKVITTETRLASGIVAPIGAYPMTKVKPINKDGGKCCVACVPKKKKAGYQAEFSGIPYEDFSFEDIVGDFEPPEVYICLSCAQYVKILHKLLSYKWWLFRAIRKQLIHYTQELGPGQKLDKDDTTDCFLKDYEWLLRCFLEFQVTLAEADKIIHTLQKESRPQVVA